MIHGNARRANGQGKRPGDTTVRISARTREALQAARARGGLQSEMSADALIRSLLQEKVYAPLPGTGVPAELIPAVEAIREQLRELPRELGMVTLAILYLRTLPEARRIQLVTLVLEQCFIDSGELPSRGEAPSP